MKGYHWNELSNNDDSRSEMILYVALSATTLLALCVLAFVLHRRCTRRKLSLANVIALDFQDNESGVEILSSLTGKSERHLSTSSDVSEGVFLMVYLPPPYEETLTKITRAASLTSSKDVESMKSMKMEDLEAKLCPELKSSGRFV